MVLKPQHRISVVLRPIRLDFFWSLHLSPLHAVVLFQKKNKFLHEFTHKRIEFGLRFTIKNYEYVCCQSQACALKHATSIANGREKE